MKYNLGGVVLLLFIIAILWCLWMRRSGCKENMSGYGVVSGLAFNNRLKYYDPGQDYPGAAYSGGTFTPGYVIF